MTAEDKSDEQKTERFNMFMSPSEMEAIEEWAWKNRIRSKSEAVRRLVQMGIESDHRMERIAKKAHDANVHASNQMGFVTEKLLEMRTTSDMSAALKLAVVAISDAYAMAADLDREVSGAKAYSDALRGTEDMKKAISEAKRIAEQHAELMRVTPLILHGDGEQKE